MRLFCHRNWYGSSLLLLLFLVFSPVVSADTLFLKDGTKLEGAIQEITPKNITIITSHMSLTISTDKIQRYEKASQQPSGSRGIKLPDKTMFEKAEELYHDGRISEALPLYQQAVKENPNNWEANQRISEIQDKLAAKITSDALNPIRPMSEGDIILSVMRKKRQTQPQAPSTPFSSSAPPSSPGTRSPFSTPRDTQTQKSAFGTPRESLPPFQDQTSSSSSPFGTTTQPDSLQGSQQVRPQAPFSAPSSPPSQSQGPFDLPGTTQAQSPQPAVSRSASPFSLPQANTTPTPLQQQPRQISSGSPFVQMQTQKKSSIASLPPAKKSSQDSPFVQLSQARSAQSSPGSVKEEFRGVWITRFDWASDQPVEIKEKILRFLDDSAASNFNAVFLQVRGQGDVFYPSPYEPWSPLLGWKHPGFDPLEFAIDEAHGRGLELHAYINPYPVWQGEEPPNHTNPEHPYWLYVQPDSDPCLACFDKSGQIMKPDKAKNDNYIYFSPGIPAVGAYIRKIVADIVQRYDVDGIHFDRIRYPGIDYSHDPISKSRFQGEGNPDALSWDDWQRDQITRFLNNVYGEVASLKPGIKISVAGWGIYNKDRYPGYAHFSSGYHQYYQDTFAWIKKGVIDAIVPMIYWDIPDPKPNYGDLAKDFIENAAGRHIYCANHVNQRKMAPGEYLAQVELTRRLGGQGNVAFSVSGLTNRGLFSYYKDNIYPGQAPVPDMPWKANPQTGIIIGNVLDQAGEPIVDAHINIEGDQETWLSSSDGFFAVLNLDPGSVRLSVTKQGVGETTSDPIQVQAGQVANVEISLGS